MPIYLETKCQSEFLKTRSPKESINIEELRPKIGIYLPVIRCDVATITAIIQKLAPKNKLYYIGTRTGKSLQGKL